MKVLITGSHGFLGKRFAELLTREGIPYEAYDRDAPEQYAEGDFEVVVNFGGRTPNSEADNNAEVADLYWDANVEGTQKLLDAIAENPNLKRIVHIGSAAEYGWSDAPLSEEAEEHPDGAYGKSKLEQTNRVRAFAQMHGVDVLNLRIFNTVGLPDRSKATAEARYAPFIFESLKAQFGAGFAGVVELNNPDDVRDYVDLDDILEAILRAVTQPHAGYDVVNICSGKGTTSREVAALFGEALGKEYELHATANRAATMSVGVNTKAHRLLGWQPTTSLKESILKII